MRREELGLSQGDVANTIGVKQAAISALETRDSRSSRQVSALAEVLNTTEKWLETGRGQKERTDGLAPPKGSPGELAPGPIVQGMVPVISWVRAGKWHEASDPFEPGDAEYYLPCPSKHSRSTYALRVDGDSMTAPAGRSYPEGSVIFVDPEQNGCGGGDRVIAKVKGRDGVIFKQLANDGGRPYLKSLNPQHPPIFDEFRVIGKVIGMWIPE